LAGDLSAAVAPASAESRDEAIGEAQARAFEAGVPSARIVRLPYANHRLFINENEFLGQMNSLLGSL